MVKLVKIKMFSFIVTIILLYFIKNMVVNVALIKSV